MFHLDKKRNAFGAMAKVLLMDLFTKLMQCILRIMMQFDREKVFWRQVV